MGSCVLLDPSPVLGLADRPPDVHDAVVEVEVRPAQGAQLPASRPSRHSGPDERAPVVTASERLVDETCGPPLRAAAAVPQQALASCLLGWVDADPAPSDSGGKGAAKYPVNVSDSGGLVRLALVRLADPLAPSAIRIEGLAGARGRLADQ
jgi:hypothetical protein